MTSRERILNAMRRQPVDHVPLWLRFWSMEEGKDNIPFEWRDQTKRAEWLIANGLDDTLLLEPPLGYTENYIADQVPGVRTTTELIPAKDGEKYPILVKEWHTPAGVLRQSINKTDDYLHGDDIHLFSDFNIPRQREAIVKSTADIPALRRLFAEPSVESQNEFNERAKRIKADAERLGVAVDGGWSALGDSAIWILGMEKVLYGQTDEPGFIEQVLDVLLEWELNRIDKVLSAGADLYTHMAWYEGTDFWSPRNFRKLLKPRLMKIAEKVHSYHVPLRYIITKGWKPIRMDLLEIGIDCISGVDPIQDNLDLAETKSVLGSQVCLMGGMNSSVTMHQGSEADIRQAVRDAFQILAPGGGFILYPVDQVFCEMEWRKTEIVMDEWKKQH